MTSEILQLVLAAILVAVAMLLVMAETAIGRVSRSQIEDVVREDAKRADRLLAVIHDRARYVNVLLFLSTIATVTATVLVGYVSVDRLVVQSDGSPALAMLVAVAVMVTVSYVVLGVAARTLGRQHAERIALAAAGPVRFLATILGPVTTLLIVVGNAVTPGKGYREGPFASQAELREMVDLAEADDLIEDDERQMIHSVFELGGTIAREVMVPRTEVVFIERDKSLRQAMSLALRSGFSRIPVVGEDADDVVGVVFLKDLVKRNFEHRDSEKVEQVGSIMRSAHFVPDSKPADELLREMQASRVHMAIVVDEFGGTAGLVTIEDILEEIVGEIDDEYDTGAPEVVRLGDGVLRVSSRLSVEHLCELTGMDLDPDRLGVETVAGLLARRLGHVPIPGAEITEQGWRLEAESAEGRRNRIGSVLVEPQSGSHV